MEFINQPLIDPDSEENRKYDPVLAQIYNAKVGKSGVPLVLCRKHYAEMRQRLAENAPECFLSVIALLPTNPNCNICVGDAYEQEEALDANSIKSVIYN